METSIDIPGAFSQEGSFYFTDKINENYMLHGHRLNWYSIRFQIPIENIEDGKKKCKENEHKNDWK